MKSELQNSIIKTLSYFDLFRYPLTREELYQFLWQPPTLSYEDFCRELRLQGENSFWHSVEGYYLLPGQAEIIGERQKSIWFAEEKIKIARRAARIVRFIPFLQGFFLCNQLPVGMKKESDIDVFVIAAPGRIWTVRFLTTFLLTCFGLRRTSLFHFLPHFLHEESHENEDNMCLSFFVTPDAFDLQPVALFSDDVYLIFWLHELTPLYDPRALHAEVLEKNKWTKTFLPFTGGGSILRSSLSVKDNVISKMCRGGGEKILKGRFGNWLENVLRRTQMKSIHKKLSAKKVESTHIVVSDSMLKFHENDRREYYKMAWKKKWKTLTSQI